MLLCSPQLLNTNGALPREGKALDVGRFAIDGRGFRVRSQQCQAEIDPSATDDHWMVIETKQKLHYGCTRGWYAEAGWFTTQEGARQRHFIKSHNSAVRGRGDRGGKKRWNGSRPGG
jgi:hypothetical protein